MQPSGMHFFPLTSPFLVGAAVLIAVAFYLVQFGILGYAYEKIGIHRHYVFSLLLLSLLGSYVNIPVAELPAERVMSDQVVQFFGMRYVIPAVQEWPRTILAVNLGGAVIPTLLSLYLVIKNRIYVQGLVGVLVVTLVVHWLAHPVKGVGIAVPTLVPPLVTAVTALLISRKCTPCVAYAAGTMGTLIGADLLNLGQIQGLGAPIASIGGAGTFDGVFLTGIIAVLLA